MLQLPVMQTWSLDLYVGGIFPRTSIFGKETDKIRNTLKKKVHMDTKQKKEKFLRNKNNMLFFPQCYSCLSNN